MGKFDAKSDEGIFLGYSHHRKTYMVLNNTTNCVKESVHIVFDETFDKTNMYKEVVLRNKLLIMVHQQKVSNLKAH